MLYPLLKTLHLLAITLWVGGMVFAQFFLRPALGALQPPQRLALMHGVLTRFFAAVTVAVALVLLTGVALFGQSPGRAPWDWTAMAAIGLLMAVVFGVIRWRLFPPMTAAVAAKDWPAAGKALAQVRLAVSVNLALGLLVIVLAVAF